MNNYKLDLYKELELNKYYWGGALKINIDVDLNSKLNLLNILNQVCKDENLIPLNEEWNHIDYVQFKHLLISALQFSLGFTNHEVMPKEDAQKYFQILTDKFHIERCKFFTNCFDNPWSNGNGVHSFNSISKHTIDLALSIIDNDKILFIYFLFED